MDACPVCGGALLDRLGTRSDGIPVLQCARCRMGIVAERPLDTSAYYSDAYYASPEAGELGYSTYSLVAAHSLAWVADLVHLLSPGGTALDVGCADGHLLRLLGPGYQLHGIEVNERLSEQCQRAGIRMLGQDVCDPRLPEEHGGSFDVITAIAVLEHVPDIRTALDQIRKLLAPEGVLVFEVPLLSPTQDNRVWFNSSLEHVYYPTLEGLAFLFESVFELPLLGREAVIRDYGSTFVGLATRSPARHRELAAFFRHLADSPISRLRSRRERSFRLFFDLVHAARSTVETTALLAELPPERVTPELLHRLAALWSLDLSRGENDGGRERETLHQQIAAALDRAELAEAQAGELRRTLARLESDLGRERERAEAAEARHEELQEVQEAQEARYAELQAKLQEAEAGIAAIAARLQESEDRLAERDRALQEVRREAERLDASLLTLVSSRAWRLVDRWWKLRAALRPGVAAWRTARFAYRLLPISGHTRFKLRGAVLAWLSVPDDAPPDVAVARLRDLVQRLSWRRATSAAALLLRGDLPSLKLHVNQLVQHSVNQETHQAAAAIAVAEHPAEFTVRRQEPWPASRPLVSVIIPCYNYGHFVSEAVDSVLAQTFQDFEILVIDGGSSSADSLAALKALDRPKTRVWFREGRHLVGDNRNFGISRAQGKYVCCLDADDMIKPTYLEKALFLLETQDYDLVSTSIRSFGDKSEVYHLERFPALADMLQGNNVSTCAVFRKDLWNRAGGYQDHGIGSDYFYEDWRLWIRFAALGARIANIVEEPLFLYRVHSCQSLSSQNQAVPSMDRQREAVTEFNRDVLTDEALRRSEENRRLKVRMEDGFVNLKNGVPAAPAGQATILIAMPFLVIGGAERLMSEVSTWLAAHGFRIVVVTTEYVYPVYGDSTAWFEKATAEIYHLPRFLEPNRWQEFIGYLLETRDVSLLWIVGSRVFYELLPRIKSDYPELKVIDLLFNTIGHTGSNRKYASCFDKILVENQEVAAWLAEAGEMPEKVLQVPSGVDLEAFRPYGKSASILSELGIAPESFIAGFSGRLSEEKDPEAFLKIARACRSDPRLVFLMTGAGPLAGQVEQRIEKMALGDSLRFLGQVEHVRGYMATYDALILPSRFDGRPVAVLESLALGVPVIASRVGALPELIQDGVTGFLCEPGDVRAFAERIRWLAAHPEEHRRMKAAARAFAESALDARQMFERYEAAIRSVLT
ncbi:MAG TPA: glycosyltransferase [Thermoanaerobaculia bacterium]|nr:glycosyltransferase [Thermoanaerobaculia bacterium]